MADLHAPRHPHDRRPDHRRSRPGHRPDRRRGPALARARDRGHRRVVDAAAVLQRPRRRRGGRAVRPRHHPGHRRRAASRPPSSSAPPTPPGVTPVIENILRASARAQKATGVPISTHTWAAGRVRRGAAGDLRAGGRRSPPRDHRPQRRQRRPRLPARADGARQHDRHGPLRPRALPAHREAGRGARPALRRRLRRQDGALARRQLLDATCSPRTTSAAPGRTGTTTTSPTTSCPRCARPASPRTRSSRCSCAIPRAIFEARKG